MIGTSLLVVLTSWPTKMIPHRPVSTTPWITCAAPQTICQCGMRAKERPCRGEGLKDWEHSQHHIASVIAVEAGDLWCQEWLLRPLIHLTYRLHLTFGGYRFFVSLNEERRVSEYRGKCNGSHNKAIRMSTKINRTPHQGHSLPTPSVPWWSTIRWIHAQYTLL